MRELEFGNILADIVAKFGEESQSVPVGHWQGLDIDTNRVPTLNSQEILNYSLAYRVIDDLEYLASDIGPNLPWADDHFLERVGRKPLNPGSEYKNWPYYYKHEAQEKIFRAGNEFTHTYMERFWPPILEGIRYNYGDLDDVISLLIRQPLTRQAYFPIWFPEDTGVVHQGRVPCTLGYHFLLREQNLHMFYTIRSCDFVRHFQDDVYLACRLLLWVIGELQERDLERWIHVVPGDLMMNMYSLHLFTGEVNKILGEW